MLFFKQNYQRKGRTGDIAKRRLLVNPYGPEMENDLNSEKGGIYESPPDRHVPNSSPANRQCKYLMYCIFSCPEAPRLRQTVMVPGLDL